MTDSDRGRRVDCSESDRRVDADDRDASEVDSDDRDASEVDSDDRDASDRDAGDGAGTDRPRIVAAAFCVVVFVGSVVPVPTAPSEGTVGGVVGVVVGTLPPEVGLTAPFHLLGYAVLAALLVGVTDRERRGAAGAVALAATAATAYGFGIELVQAPIPWRSFAWIDAGINAVGAIVGAIVGAVAGPVVGALAGAIPALEGPR